MLTRTVKSKKEKVEIQNFSKFIGVCYELNRWQMRIRWLVLKNPTSPTAGRVHFYFSFLKKVRI